MLFIVDNNNSFGNFWEHFSTETSIYSGRISEIQKNENEKIISYESVDGLVHYKHTIYTHPRTHTHRIQGSTESSEIYSYLPMCVFVCIQLHYRISYHKQEFTRIDDDHQFKFIQILFTLNEKSKKQQIEQQRQQQRIKKILVST